jgi:hypothetical protein
MKYLNQRKIRMKISEIHFLNRVMLYASRRRTDMLALQPRVANAQKLLIPPVGLGSTSHNLRYTNDPDRPE